MPSATTDAEHSNPFVKQLASSNRRTRDSALDSLRTYLQRSAPFAELDFLKLWKGLFYCMWMSDKPLTQQRLARDLASLLHVLRGNENFLGFVDAFWKTMAREWGGIDALRMDKFLYLARCYINQGFERVSKQQWSDERLLKDYLKILEATPLNTNNGKIPNGIRFHVVEIYVDELDRVDTKRSAPLETILQPLQSLAQDSPTKAVRERASEALNDERLSDWQHIRSEDSEEDATANGNQPRASAADLDEDVDASEEDDDEFGGFAD